MTKNITRQRFALILGRRQVFNGFRVLYIIFCTLPKIDVI